MKHSRWIVLFLVLVMGLSVCIASATEVTPTEEIPIGGTCGDNLTWSLVDGTLQISGSGAMTDFSSINRVPWYHYMDQITKVEFSEDITHIGAFAFQTCNKITHITFPASIKSLGDYAFYGCSGLQELIFHGDQPTFKFFTTFYGFNQTVYAYYPEGNTTWTLELGNSIIMIEGKPGRSGQLGSITWKLEGDTLTISGTGKLPDCKDRPTTHRNWFRYENEIKNLKIGEGITSLGAYNFCYLEHLQSVQLPSTLNYIGQMCFAGCTELQSITIPNTVTFIGCMAFFKCASLQTLTIPAGVQEIDEMAFGSCTGLDTVTFVGDPPTMGTPFPGCIFTGYYPGDNEKWTEDVINNMQYDISDEIVWLPYYSEPDPTEPETTVPETTEPATEPETTVPVTTRPVTTQPPVTQPPATQPETTVPETTEPETTELETTVPETTEPVTQPETTVSDTTLPTPETEDNTAPVEDTNPKKDNVLWVWIAGGAVLVAGAAFLLIRKRKI